MKLLLNLVLFQVSDKSGTRGKFCGSDIPYNGDTIRSTTYWFKIKFHSDLVTEKKGFSVSYSVIGK